MFEKMIKEKAVDVQTYMAEVDGNLSDEERIETLRKFSETKKWLYRQIDEKKLNNNFGAYLRVSPNGHWLNRITIAFSRWREARRR